jgi:hypothetical protein
MEVEETEEPEVDDRDVEEIEEMEVEETEEPEGGDQETAVESTIPKHLSADEAIWLQSREMKRQKQMIQRRLMSMRQKSRDR